MTPLYAPREGRTYGRLTVVSVHELSKTGDGNHLYVCACSCGATTVKRWKPIRKGKVKSCGCLLAELRSAASAKREAKAAATIARAQRVAKSAHPLYQTYQSMVKRCTKRYSSSYNRYGGAGVTVCDRWLGSFDAFVSDMGAKPEGTSLDRIDNNKGYSPENCRWATKVEQYSNRRQRAIYVATIRGETKPVTEWAAKFKINPDKVKLAIREGEDPAVSVIAAYLRKRTVEDGARPVQATWDACREAAVKWVKS